MSDLLFYLKENRHIFSICPGCGEIHRLSDLMISRKGAYKADWLDNIEHQEKQWDERKRKLEAQRRDLERSAKEKAEQEELPKALNKVDPVFTRMKIDLRDVRCIFHPVEFIVFDGMNSESGVNQISILHLGKPNNLLKSMESTIKGNNFGWNTIRIGDDGCVTEKRE